MESERKNRSSDYGMKKSVPQLEEDIDFNKVAALFYYVKLMGHALDLWRQGAAIQKDEAFFTFASEEVKDVIQSTSPGKVEESAIRTELLSQTSDLPKSEPLSVSPFQISQKLTGNPEFTTIQSSIKEVLLVSYCE